MNEAETRAEHIDPALKAAGWGVVEGSRILREHRIAPGRLQGGGKRHKPEIADYVLVYRNLKLAVVEAKPWGAPYTEGVAQAKEYAKKLAVRFTYSTNGQKIYGIDMETGKEGDVADYPGPEALWTLTFAEQNEWRDRFAKVPYEDKGGSHCTRYYQDIAIQNVMEAIAGGEERILLTLATGTGKTFIAFQIAWKLFHSRWTLNRDAQRRPRILFLADRNILADQAYNAFSAFPEDAMVRIAPEDIRKKGKVPKNGSIFFTIFQTFMCENGNTTSGNALPGNANLPIGSSSPGNANLPIGSSKSANQEIGVPREDIPREDGPAYYFGGYPQDFFDLIIIDECHRGGANDESSWRGIMEYFSPAVQLGLTATPKRKENADTYKYFGEPVFVYSLKDGINDGYLTPFKVRQISTTLDEYVYTPDDVLVEGEVEQGKRYTEKDFNKIIEIKEREAYRVGLFMEMIDQREKTLVFCATQLHALAVRDLVNQMKSAKDPDYCHRVTADDGKLGDQWLRDFQDNEKSVPTILTTSQKLSTGVDARNVRNIVLMRPVNSMIEFKQIIGRGTRLYDGKDYFTIYDFVKAHHHFSDPEWDGEPAEPTGPTITRVKEDPPEPPYPGPEPPEPRKEKIRIKLADGKERAIQHMAATTFWSPDGTPMSAAQFLESLFGALPDFFKNEDELRAIWSVPDTRKAFLQGLADRGFGPEPMAEMQRIIDAEKSDLFDVLAYVAFAMPTVTRAERAAAARTRLHGRFTAKQEAFLDFVLSHYVRQGVEELDQEKLAPLIRLRYNNAVADAVADLGKPHEIRRIFTGFQKYLYQPAHGGTHRYGFASA
ncbi:MAG: DEAD/DEAH box helicase family protein [Candidatus Hydrogenedentes bacterium]|nr:DEAD/DEAH box helicase family protein [Candidatus Hydrogenedentota bacterium]